MNPENIKLGDTITVGMGLKLCEHFKLGYLADRLEANPERYRDFEFDGCSYIPDKMMWILTKKRWQDITYKCCLPHGLAYAYCAPWDEYEREIVDNVFRSNLTIFSGMPKWIISIFFFAVRIGGEGKTDFSWGFGSKEVV